MSTDYRRGVVFCLIATVSWGVMFPIMTDALKRIDPYTFTSLRYGFASLIFLAALVRAEGWKALNLKGERAGLAWLIGTIGFVGFGFLVFLGQKLAGPSGALTASIMMATMPMLGFLVNWVLRKVVPPIVSFLFILMSFGGVVTVITKGDFYSLVDRPQNYSANLLIILGALCWVIYTVGSSFFPKWSPYRYTAVTTLLGIISVFTLNGIFYATHFVPVPSVSDFVYIIPHVTYMAVIAGFVGVLCWTFGNKILTPLNGVLFMDVVPITAFLVSTLQGITPTHVQAIGACITGAALILNNIYMRKCAIAGLAKPAPMSAAAPGAAPASP
jgi:drug/metabolite transporter (DMT)-like permease